MLLNIDQRRIVDSDVTGDMLIRGVAGSGKTTVAVARIPILLDYHCKEGDKVLLLTYNRSLQNYVQHLYQKYDRQTTLIDLEEDNDDRLIIKTIDSIIYGLFKSLRDNRYKAARIPSQHDQYEVIKYVISKLGKKYSQISWYNEGNARFLLNEIEWIMGCDYDAIKLYQEADRTGRASFVRDEGQGVQRIKKNSVQREAIYDTYQLYRERMHNENLYDFSDMAKIVKDNADKIIRTKYTHIIVDEAQDLSKCQLDVISALYNRKDYGSAIFITDTAQSIYEKSWLSYNPFTTIGFNMHGRSRVLSKNYRTTKQVAMAAYSLMDNVEQITSNELYVKPKMLEREGNFPMYSSFKNDEQEYAYLVKKIGRLTKRFSLKDIVVISRNKKQLEMARTYLVNNGIDAKLYNDSISFEDDIVKMFTMHAIKGLEFKVIFIIGLNDGIIPYMGCCEVDDIGNNEIQDRKLLYVGMTRAEEKLYMSSSGKPSKFIADINKDYLITNDLEPFEHIEKMPESNYIFKDKLIELHNKEEMVRQGVLHSIMNDLGYPIDCIDIEVPVKQYSRKGYADIVLHHSKTKEKPLIVIECKEPSQDIKKHKEQLFDYMKALPSVRFGMLTNGTNHYFFEKNGHNMLERAMLPSYENLISTVDKTYIYKNLHTNREFLYIISGYDNMNISVKFVDSDGLIPVGDYRNVGIYGNVSAGLFKTIDNSVNEVSRQIPIPKDWLQECYDYMMLRADGDSMLGAGIEPRDYVIVRKQQTVDNYDIAIVVVNDEATMKKVVRMGEHIMLMPENSKYEPMMCNPDNVWIAGKVVGVLKSGF